MRSLRAERDFLSLTAGEYVPIAFLGESTLGVVTALRNMKAVQETRYVKNGDRQGFSWWRFEGQ
jgi:hypothetical protein